MKASNDKAENNTAERLLGSMYVQTIEWTIAHWNWKGTEKSSLMHVCKYHLCGPFHRNIYSEYLCFVFPMCAVLTLY